MSNKITCNSYVYEDGDINSGNCYLGNSLANEELSIDTLDADIKLDDENVVFQPSDADSFQSSNGEKLTCANPVNGYAYGDPLLLERDESLIGKFYFESLKRKSVSLYALAATSAMGLLDNMTHYGGIYSNIPAGTIIAGIMGSVPYAIGEDVAAVPVNGYLPIDTCRNNLQQVLFAIGAGVFKNADGEVLIRFLLAGAPATIPPGRIYADGSVAYETPCTEVDVTEHTYYAYADDKTVTLLDTSDVLASQRITFDNPCHDLAASEGLAIEESGVNYAIVSGTGTLTGREYTHTQKIIAYQTGVNGAKNVASVTDATLVSALNSYNVAKRVAQYYSAVSTMSVGFAVDGERPASMVAFTDPFGDPVSGYIKSMDLTLSHVLKADTEIAVGFVPTGQGNNYKHFIILTGSGSWTVPDGVERIRVVRIGGGSGGAGGTNGTAGDDGTNGTQYIGTTDSSVATPGESGGAGGDGGDGGAPGKVCITTETVASGELISYSCGVGGSGGDIGGLAGEPGTDTTFNGISSSSGSTPDSGYVDIISGTNYAAPGADGVDGGDGGKGGGWESNRESDGENGGSAEDGTPGGLGAEAIFYDGGSHDYYMGGGAGGGASKGVSGSDGTQGYYSEGSMYRSYGGNGGAGANAPAASDGATYGSGGEGGSGGGGGGSGAGSVLATTSTARHHANAGTGGSGGTGSAGGAGAPGCVIIYY